MDTLQEALFKAMLNNDWFTASDGDVEFSLGYFGYMANSAADWYEVYHAFEDTIKAYNSPAVELGTNDAWVKENFVGVWFASIKDQGIIRISRIGDYDPTGIAHIGIAPTAEVKAAQKRFEDSQRDFIDWNNETGE
jgi:hypothetical protein